MISSTDGNRLTRSCLAQVLGGIVLTQRYHYLERGYQLFLNEWVLLRYLTVGEKSLFSLCGWEMLLAKQWESSIMEG